MRYSRCAIRAFLATLMLFFALAIAVPHTRTGDKFALRQSSALLSTTAQASSSPKRVVRTPEATSKVRKSSSALRISIHQQNVDHNGRRACRFVNQVRAQHGRPALYYSGTLTQRAYSHSNWMLWNNVFTHQDIGRLGFTVFDSRVGRNRYMYVNGENIANSVHRSSDVAHDFHWQWVYSPPHFENMLGWGHTHCGTGLAYDSRYNTWWATQLFGRNDFPFPDEFNLQTPA